MTDHSISVTLNGNGARLHLAEQTIDIVPGADTGRKYGCPVELVLGALGS